MRECRLRAFVAKKESFLRVLRPFATENTEVTGGN